jgi:hypothetical protein
MSGSQLAFSNITDTGERCESAKRMYIQSDARRKKAPSAVRVFANQCNSRMCAGANLLRAVIESCGYQRSLGLVCGECQRCACDGCTRL